MADFNYMQFDEQAQEYRGVLNDGTGRKVHVKPEAWKMYQEGALLNNPAFWFYERQNDNSLKGLVSVEEKDTLVHALMDTATDTVFFESNGYSFYVSRIYATEDTVKNLHLAICKEAMPPFEEKDFNDTDEIEAFLTGWQGYESGSAVWQEAQEEV